MILSLVSENAGERIVWVREEGNRAEGLESNTFTNYDGTCKRKSDCRQLCPGIIGTHEHGCPSRDKIDMAAMHSSTSGHRPSKRTHNSGCADIFSMGCSLGLLCSECAVPLFFFMCHRLICMLLIPTLLAAACLVFLRECPTADSQLRGNSNSIAITVPLSHCAPWIRDLIWSNSFFWHFTFKQLLQLLWCCTLLISILLCLSYPQSHVDACMSLSVDGFKEKEKMFVLHQSRRWQPGSSYALRGMESLTSVFAGSATNENALVTGSGASPHFLWQVHTCSQNSDSNCWQLNHPKIMLDR